MAINATHTVVVGGKTFTRKSPRTYTHAIVGRWSKETALARLQSNAEAYRVQDVKNWQFTRDMADPTSDTYKRHMANLSPEYGAQVAPRYKQDFARALELGKTAPEYAAKLAADRQAAHDKWVAEGGDQLTVLAWSQSAANAAKAANSWRSKGYSDVEAVPCNRK
jgi:hypothetical protein